MFGQKFIKTLRVDEGERPRLSKRPTSWTKEVAKLTGLSKSEAKAKAETSLAEDLAELATAQELLYASDRFAVLLIFQGMDASGKDGTIKHVMSGVNPQGCQVFSFKVPSAEEIDHNFLWRHMKALPERGRIGIFNRSYYEDVLVVRVHPEILERSRLPDGKRNAAFWRDRFEDISAFERHLHRNGTVILKFFLHMSKEEQRQRFLERLVNKEKHWKFSLGDVRERGFWDDYTEAYEEAIAATSTADSPWYVIPADHKWLARALVADTVTSTIARLRLDLPVVSADERRAFAEARRRLEAEE